MDVIKINNAEEFMQYISGDPNWGTTVDVENVDLSGLPELVNPIIQHYNLHNTNLKIVVAVGNKYDRYNIYDSDLRGVNIRIDNPDYGLDHYSFIAHSRHFHLGLSKVLLDEKQIEYLNGLCEKNSNLYIADYDTVIKNKCLRISAANVIKICSEKIYNVDRSSDHTRIMSYDQIKKIVTEIEDFLELCNSPCMKELYNNIKDQLTDWEKIQMFCYHNIIGKTFHDIKINREMYIALQYLDCLECNFENVIFDVPTKFLTNNNSLYFPVGGFTMLNVKNATFPNIKYSDWKVIEQNRVGLQTPITFRRNLYLELGRDCNANCTFCRNKCMEKTEYDLDNIIHALNGTIKLFDTIYIAGGEPSLKTADISKLLSGVESDKQFTVITNGTQKLKELFSTQKGLNYMISRHSYDEEENAKIFGIPANNFLSLQDIVKESGYKTTLSCTCIQGGMDTVEKIIEYIKYASSHYIENVVFTNLHDDSSVALKENNKKTAKLNIDGSIFDEVIALLQTNGMIETRFPIISSGGYELRTFKRKFNHIFDYMTISFKRYVAKNELDKLWVNAVKRTFDLSMSPDGTLYDTWSEDEKAKELILK